MKPRAFSNPITRIAATWLLGIAVLVAAGIAVRGETAAMPSDKATPLGTAAQVRIDKPTVAVPLDTSPAAERLGQALAAPSSHLAPKLALGGITVAHPPGVLFNVYLATAGPHPQRQYVGTLSFFGVEGDGPVTLPARNFNVAGPLRALQGTGASLAGLQVIFEATDGTSGSTVAKAAPLFNSKAGLKVGSVRLEVEEKR
ncbi:MAG TPA: hypothetical protein VF173_24230 [Thermoanaerobaculia bacterium]|nr:hypothetical protein [Thermoanaerobaculia bacterium]